LKAEIRNFCKDLHANRTKSFNDPEYNFVMKYKDVSRSQAMYVGSRSISKNGIFVNSLGNNISPKFSSIIEKYQPIKECVLIKNNIFKKYYLYIPFEKETKDIDNRHKVIALDPGEKTFLSFYSLNSYGKIGDNMRTKIIPMQREIRKLQSAIDIGKNKKGKKLKNKSRLRKKINKKYLKIHNKVHELHKKAAKYLCENYENIILPDFKIKPMISNKKENEEKERIRKIEDIEEANKERRELKKKIKMSNESKFVLERLSHYKFKLYLKAKAEEYKTIVYDVIESHTSQACTICGELSKTYDKNRIKICDNCNSRIDRDVNGSRNILIKALREIGKITPLKVRRSAKAD